VVWGAVCLVLAVTAITLGSARYLLANRVINLESPTPVCVINEPQRGMMGASVNVEPRVADKHVIALCSSDHFTHAINRNPFSRDLLFRPDIIAGNSDIVGGIKQYARNVGASVERLVVNLPSDIVRGSSTDIVNVEFDTDSKRSLIVDGENISPEF